MISSARLAGRSQGAFSLSASRAAARLAGGFHWRGGVTRTERGMAGCSDTIIAVSARKRCSAANESAAVPGCAVLACAALADRLLAARSRAAVGALARTWLSPLSDRATFRPPSTPSRALVMALGVYPAAVLGGIRVSFRTTECQRSAARLPRTP